MIFKSIGISHRTRLYIYRAVFDVLWYGGRGALSVARARALRVFLSRRDDASRDR